MINSATALGTVETAMLALRLAVQQERNVAAIALQEAANKPSFDGKGSSDPRLGKILDVSV